MLGHKSCTLCKLEKHKSDFSKNKKHPDGLSYWCRNCNAQQSKTWRLNNPEKKVKANKQKGLKSRYGLSIDQYNQLLIAQNYKCAICNKPETAKHSDKNSIKALAVDHCHATGKIRGLLCDACNRAEGFLRGSPKLARKLAEYLELHSGKIEE